jgi:hypothetical protein
VEAAALPKAVSGGVIRNGTGHEVNLRLPVVASAFLAVLAKDYYPYQRFCSYFQTGQNSIF